ncbi:MAG: hypothetical protein M3R02_05220 [Chloroflexota bacterium]|nr:hypothetical protein [Chloroflexota bacterium]
MDGTVDLLKMTQLSAYVRELHVEALHRIAREEGHGKASRTLTRILDEAMKEHFGRRWYDEIAAQAEVA